MICAHAIFVRSGEWVNPSSYKLRSFVEGHRNEMAAAMSGYSTVIVVSNLAGRAGTAIAPLVCKMAKDSSKSVISITIMPFNTKPIAFSALGLLSEECAKFQIQQ